MLLIILAMWSGCYPGRHHVLRRATTTRAIRSTMPWRQLRYCKRVQVQQCLCIMFEVKFDSIYPLTLGTASWTLSSLPVAAAMHSLLLLFFFFFFFDVSMFVLMIIPVFILQVLWVLFCRSICKQMYEIQSRRNSSGRWATAFHNILHKTPSHVCRVCKVPWPRPVIKTVRTIRIHRTKGCRRICLGAGAIWSGATSTTGSNTKHAISCG